MISFMITTGSLNSQDVIRILKQWKHDFPGKHLCDGYCMDNMWCLRVVKIHGFVTSTCKSWGSTAAVLVLSLPSIVLGLDLL